MNIERIKSDLNVSYETLARMLGCSVQSIYRWREHQPSNVYKREIQRLLEEIKRA